MSVNINVTIPVPLEDIAHIKLGWSAGLQVKHKATAAIEKEVLVLPYRVIPGSILSPNQIFQLHTQSVDWKDHHHRRDRQYHYGAAHQQDPG